MLCCVVLLNAVLCVVLCRDVWGLWSPEGLIKADTETGCITALMKSVSTDCTQGQLRSAAPPLTTYIEEGES